MMLLKPYHVVYRSPDDDAGGSTDNDPKDAPVNAPDDDPKPDPYEGLTDEERAAAKEADRTLGELSPVDRAHVLHLARMKHKEIEAAQSKPKDDDKPAQKQKPKEQKPASGDDDVPAWGKKVLEELDEYRRDRDEQKKERERQKIASQAAQDWKDFDAEMESVLDSDDDIGDDPDERRDMKEDFLGRYIKLQRKPVAGAQRTKAFKEFVEKQKARFDKRAKGATRAYVDDKLDSARATRTETRSGGAKGKETKPFTYQDFNDGKLAAALKEKYEPGR
jgi:hypothetical protein